MVKFVGEPSCYCQKQKQIHRSQKLRDIWLSGEISDRTFTRDLKLTFSKPLNAHVQLFNVSVGYLLHNILFSNKVNRKNHKGLIHELTSKRSGSVTICI